MKGFWEAVTDNGEKPCALLGVGRECLRQKDAHHFILDQRLPTLEARVDPRNGVCLCRLHHEAVHHRTNPLRCPRPPLLDEFLHDHGLLESGRPDPKRRAA